MRKLLTPPPQSISRYLYTEAALVVVAVLIGVYGCRVGEPWWADTAIMVSVWTVGLMYIQIGSLRFEFSRTEGTPEGVPSPTESPQRYLNQSTHYLGLAILCAGAGVIYLISTQKRALFGAFLLLFAYQVWGCLLSYKRYTNVIETNNSSAD